MPYRFPFLQISLKKILITLLLLFCSFYALAENQSLGSEPLQKLTLAQIEFAKNSAKSDLTLNEA
ncbi:MAG: hypothetical protein KZQ92_09195, partial [Candidatus Thiodiazotropha sp. (ex Lucinoma borealis)]|nr:hypothetical protein [Candidatus Thiodiazotropha sp. (ex Lucinoma borealis)]